MTENKRAPEGTGAPDKTTQIVERQPSKMELAVRSATEQITATLNDCAIERIKELPAMQRTMQLAAGMRVLRTALTKEIVTDLFIPLMGSRLGFRTDRDSKPANEQYGWEVVRDCVIEALIRGIHPTGNELNIIAGSAYFTREAFTRKVAQFPGLTDLAISTGVPHVASEEGALVPFHASWKLDGIPNSLVCDLMKVTDETGAARMVDLRIPVKRNKLQGADALIGKCMRKGLHRIYERLNGSEFSAPDGDLETTATVISESSAPTKVAGQAGQMAQLLQRVKPSGVEGGTVVPDTQSNPVTSEPEETDAEKLRREVAEQDARDRDEAGGK